VLQPGIYSVQLSANPVDMALPNNTGGGVGLTLWILVNGNKVAAIEATGLINRNGDVSEAEFPLIVNELLQISGANSVVDFNVHSFDGDSASLPEGCRIIFTRLQ
jgi:hypothetical protein